MMKIEQDKNMAIHMPLCRMEDLSGLRPITKDEINGNSPLLNQPKWRLALFKLHNQSILEYAAAPWDRQIDPTYYTLLGDNTHGLNLIS